MRALPLACPKVLTPEMFWTGSLFCQPISAQFQCPDPALALCTVVDFTPCAWLLKIALVHGILLPGHWMCHLSRLVKQEQGLCQAMLGTCWDGRHEGGAQVLLFPFCKVPEGLIQSPLELMGAFPLCPAGFRSIPRCLGQVGNIQVNARGCCRCGLEGDWTTRQGSHDSCRA